MVYPMPGKLLLSKSARLATRNAVDDGLPMRVADLDGCELHAHCDGCGRQLRLYPGHAGFALGTLLTGLLDRLVCSARRNGRACGGRPRRLILVRDERRWVLEDSGGWVEDGSLFWEPSDFEAPLQRSGRQAAF